MTTPPWAAHLPPGTDVGDVDLAPAPNLTAAWAARWRSAPDHPVVAGPAAGGGLHADLRWLTGAELDEASAAVAAALGARGVVPGDRLLLSAEPSVELVLAYVAALRAGAVVVPANTAYRARELAHVVADAHPVLAVVDDAERARILAGTEPAPAVEDLAALVADACGPGARSAGEVALDLAGLDDPALIAYTSGTTGAPKGAVLSHGNLLASAEALRLAWRWTPEDRLVLPLPLFHLHGLGVGLGGTLHAGATVVLRPRFDPGDVLDAVAAHRATLLFGVPTTWSRLAATGRAAELASLRLGVSGSAPLDPGLFAAIEAASGHRLLERYGMTETVMNVSNPFDGERRPGTVGLPLPGVEVRLAPETDEVELRGPNVFSGYWQRPDATAEAFDGDWFASGDVGALDADGYLRIVGRRKELIISGGYNVYPREVADVLRAHPAVHDAAIVGLPHPDWGEEVVAVVEGTGGDDETAALAAWAAERLAPYKRPKRIAWVDALPRNALGKVVLDEVRARVR
ncbi:MAG: AMP-binding protein [Acidimicrobiales bacterium]|nr:AMP-binding protein [Acidimicrobiales bacterium]